MDIEAFETAVRSRAIEIAASVLERALNAEEETWPERCACGGMLHCAGRFSKTVRSVLGALTLTRTYVVCSLCQSGFFPHDRTRGLEGASLTPGVVRMIGVVGSMVSFEEGASLLAELAGLRVSSKQVERTAESLGEEIAREEAEEVSSDPGPVPSTLYMGLDGTGLPMRKEKLEGRAGKQADGSSKTREVKLCTLFSASVSDPEIGPVRDPDSVTYSAAIESAAATGSTPSDFARRIDRESERRRFMEAKRRVVIGDGALWIWNLASEHFPDAIEIIDLFHAKQHLSETAKEIFGPQSPKTRPWAQDRHDELDEGHFDDLLKELSIHAPRIEAARLCLGYFETNRDRMRYPEFRKQELCVSSGVVEAGCKVAIGARLKRAGMHWTVDGANAIIALHCCRLSGRFEAFWERLPYGGRLDPPGPVRIPKV